MKSIRGRNDFLASSQPKMKAARRVGMTELRKGMRKRIQPGTVVVTYLGMALGIFRAIVVKVHKRLERDEAENDLGSFAIGDPRVWDPVPIRIVGYGLKRFVQ